MSAHVLFNLLNELRKRYKMRGLLVFFAMSQIINNTGARMLDFIYHMALKLQLKSHFLAQKLQDFVIFFAML